MEGGRIRGEGTGRELREGDSGHQAHRDTGMAGAQEPESFPGTEQVGVVRGCNVTTPTMKQVAQARTVRPGWGSPRLRQSGFVHKLVK